MQKEILDIYNPVKLDKIKSVIEQARAKGKGRFYEIWVDGMKVVEKTNDPAEFDRHEEFICPDTRSVVVNLFTATESSAHIVSRHHFTFGEEPKRNDDSLRGFGLGEIEARINEKVTLERERWESEQLRKELETTRIKLREAEDWNEKLEAIIDETKSKLEEAKGLSDFTSLIKELAVSKFMGRSAEEKSLSGGAKPKEEASFTMGENLTEDEKFFLEFGKNMKASFTKEEFDSIMDIIAEFVRDKNNIKPVVELLNIKQKAQ